MPCKVTIDRLSAPELAGLPILLAVILVLAVLPGCSNALRWEGEGNTPISSVPAVSRGVTKPRHVAADTAVTMIGTPYRYGGSTPKGFDCSGLVQYSYSAAGVKVPRTSGDQYGSATPISLTDAEPGDLLFFRYDHKISHVAIYLGDERFVHAPSSGKTVSVASLRDPHYQQHFVRAGRL